MKKIFLVLIVIFLSACNPTKIIPDATKESDDIKTVIDDTKQLEMDLTLTSGKPVTVS